MPVYKKKCPVCGKRWELFCPNDDTFPPHSICFSCWLSSDEDPKSFDEKLRQSGLEPFRNEDGIGKDLLTEVVIADERLFEKAITDN